MNIKKKFRSINSKTLVYLIAFSISIITVLWFFQSLFLNIVYEKYQIDNINKIASTITYTKTRDLYITLEKLAYEHQVCIEIVDTEYAQTISYNTLMNGCLLGKNNHYIERYKKEMMESKESNDTYTLVNQEYQSKAVLSGVENDGYYVFVYANLEDINATASLLKGQIIYIALISTLFATLIAYFLSHKITDPIAKITNNAKRFAAGDYEIKFAKNGVTEIDELADTLTYVGSEFQKTDQMRRDLMANVSHDLKTPLTMIKAYSEMVRDISYKDNKKRLEHLNIIIEETDRLNILVNDILALSKIQAEAESLIIEEYDLSKEIKGIIKKYNIIKETEDYKFNLDVPKKCLVLADKNKINQAVYNLVNNAINYTGKDKTINIRVEEEEENYLVSIIDSGKGIKDDDMKHIWDKYYKNEKKHQRNLVGTGLGLSIVKGILENHNFEYGVYTKKNIGTTFYFKIKKCK